MRTLRYPWGVAIIASIVCLITVGMERDASCDKQTNKKVVVQGAVGDMVCGPRCVQFLLRNYGKDADLIDLTRETQWPDFEAGASLDLLEQALKKRGVYTQALRIGSRVRIRWPYPVLLHLKGKSGIGHYVVWLSSDGDNAQVWGGLAGIRWGENDRLAERCSGVILLTSPEPITNPESAVYRPVRVLPWVFVAVSLILLLAVLKPGIYRLLRRLTWSLAGKEIKRPADISGSVITHTSLAQERKENVR